MAPIIEAQGLTKRFGDVQALDGLSLTAESGHVTFCNSVRTSPTKSRMERMLSAMP